MMKIAMIGSRGLGSGYSGIENMLNEVCPRLVNLGCTVDVYGHVDAPMLSAIGLREIPTRSIGGKHFENISRSAWATLRALRRYDIVHFHAIGPGILSALALCSGQRSVVTCHGLDYDRAKWGTVAKLALRLGERTSVICSNHITVVAPGLKQYYRQAYGCEVSFIPTGFKIQTKKPPGATLTALGLSPGYVLFASRITPEKGIEDLIEVYNQLPIIRPLVITSEARTSTASERAWATKLHQMADPSKVVFVGRQSDEAMAEIFSNAYLHVLPSYIEGWSMSLTEALGYRIPSLASDIDANREVMGDHGFYFKVRDKSDLKLQLSWLLGNQKKVDALRRSLETLRLSDWDEVTASYLKVYQSIKPTLLSQ